MRLIHNFPVFVINLLYFSWIFPCANLDYLGQCPSPVLKHPTGCLCQFKQ